MGVWRDPDQLSATDPRSPRLQLGEAVSHIGLVGRRIAQYEVLGFVAAGGMGEVFRARDTQLARTVAIKVLRPGADDRDRARLQREARAMAKLHSR
jgi:eukaryotic-like serine/threonine-protein kinase